MAVWLVWYIKMRLRLHNNYELDSEASTCRFIRIEYWQETQNNYLQPSNTCQNDPLKIYPPLCSISTRMVETTMSTRVDWWDAKIWICVCKEPTIFSTMRTGSVVKLLRNKTDCGFKTLPCGIPLINVSTQNSRQGPSSTIKLYPELALLDKTEAHLVDTHFNTIALRYKRSWQRFLATAFTPNLTTI